MHKGSYVSMRRLSNILELKTTYLAFKLCFKTFKKHINVFAGNSTNKLRTSQHTEFHSQTVEIWERNMNHKKYFTPGNIVERKNNAADKELRSLNPHNQNWS